MHTTCQNANTTAQTRPDANRPSPIANNQYAPKQSKGTVYLIDSDVQVRAALSGLLISINVNVIAVESMANYCQRATLAEPGCLIVDMQMRDINGADLQSIMDKEINPPVVFITGQPDVPAMVRAMKAGAIEILTKPVNPTALVEAVYEAFAQDVKARLRRAELKRLQERFSLLTPREREVLPLIVGGLLNKQAALILGISEVTLQIHRSQVMRKMEAESFADLVRMASKLRIPYWRPTPRHLEPTNQAFHNWTQTQLAVSGR